MSRFFKGSRTSTNPKTPTKKNPSPFSNVKKPATPSFSAIKSNINKVNSNILSGKRKDKSNSYKELEDEVDHITSHQKKILKALEKTEKDAKKYMESMSHFVETVKEYGTFLVRGPNPDLMTTDIPDNENTQFGKTLLKFSRVLSQVEGARQQMVQDQEACLVETLKTFLNSEYSSVKNAQRSFDKASAQLVSAEGTKKSADQKKTKAAKILEAETGLERAQVSFDTQRNEALACMQTFIQKNRGDIMTKYCDFMQLYLDFSRESLDLTSPIEKYNNQLKEAVEQKETKLAEQRALDDALRQEQQTTQFYKNCHSFAHLVISPRIEIVKAVYSSNTAVLTSLAKSFFHIHEVYGDVPSLILTMVAHNSPQVNSIVENTNTQILYLFNGNPFAVSMLREFVAAYGRHWLSTSLTTPLILPVVISEIKSLFASNSCPAPKFFFPRLDDEGTKTIYIETPESEDTFPTEKFSFSKSMIPLIQDLVSKVMTSIFDSTDNTPEPIRRICQLLAAFVQESAVKLAAPAPSSLNPTNSSFSTGTLLGSVLPQVGYNDTDSSLSSGSAANSTGLPNSTDGPPGSASPKSVQKLSARSGMRLRRRSNSLSLRRKKSGSVSSTNLNKPSTLAHETSEGVSSRASTEADRPDSARSAGSSGSVDSSTSQGSSSPSELGSISSLDSAVTVTVTSPAAAADTQSSPQMLAIAEKIKRQTQNKVRAAISNFIFPHCWLPAITCPHLFLLYHTEQYDDSPFSPGTKSLEILEIVGTIIHNIVSHIHFPKSSRFMPFNDLIDEFQPRIHTYLDNLSFDPERADGQPDIIVPSQSVLHKSQKNFFSIVQVNNYQDALDFVRTRDIPNIVQLITDNMAEIDTQMTQSGYEPLLRMLPEKLSPLRSYIEQHNL